MAGRVTAKLAGLGITLPTPPKPVATYVPFVVTGDLVFVSGQGPTQDGKVTLTRAAWLDNQTVELGQEAARVAFCNVLAQLAVACEGDLDRVTQVVRLGGFVASGPGFVEHAQVMNGASDLSVAVFGEVGRHARTTIGVASLPLDMAVEVDGVFRIA